MTPRRKASRIFRLSNKFGFGDSSAAAFGLVISALLGAPWSAHAQFSGVPEPAECLDAFETLDSWIRHWDVPVEAEPIDPPGAQGASVTIRLEGRILGRASALSEVGDAMWRAARSALLEATSALPVPPEQDRQALAMEAAPRMTVECEIAGAFTPLLGASYETAAALSPGRFGLGARVGDRVEAIFPSEALMSGASPPVAMRAAVGKLDLPPLELSELRERSNLTVYRFGVRHVVRERDGAVAQFLYRGDRIVPIGEVSRERLIHMADALTRHLLTHKWPGEEPHGMLGDYLIHADTYDPMIAPPAAQSLAALALARYASMVDDRGDEALELARLVVQQATVVTADEVDPLATTGAAAMWLIARREVERSLGATLEAPNEFEQAAIERVKSAFDPASGWSADLRPGERAVVALALVELAQAGTVGRDRAERAIRMLFRDTDVGQMPSLLPWLGWAEQRLAGEGKPLPAIQRLRESRELIWDHQIGKLDVDADGRDLVGGIIFTRGGVALPSAQGLRPLAFLASALGDERLTRADEFAAEVAAIRPSLRFLIQLVPDSRDCMLLPDCRRAVGGVRMSGWDQRQPIEATALGLLVACETLTALERTIE